MRDRCGVRTCFGELVGRVRSLLSKRRCFVTFPLVLLRQVSFPLFPSLVTVTRVAVTVAGQRGFAPGIGRDPRMQANRFEQLFVARSLFPPNVGKGGFGAAMLRCEGTRAEADRAGKCG